MMLSQRTIELKAEAGESIGALKQVVQTGTIVVLCVEPAHTSTPQRCFFKESHPPHSRHLKVSQTQLTTNTSHMVQWTLMV